MGGLVCNVHKNAVLRFQTVPTNPADQAKFDDQIRQLYNAPSIAESVVSDTSKAVTVCAILAQAVFSQADRQKLLDVIESLYEGYA